MWDSLVRNLPTIIRTAPPVLMVLAQVIKMIDEEFFDEDDSPGRSASSSHDDPFVDVN